MIVEPRFCLAALIKYAIEKETQFSSLLAFSTCHSLLPFSRFHLLLGLWPKALKSGVLSLCLIDPFGSDLKLPSLGIGEHSQLNTYNCKSFTYLLEKSRPLVHLQLLQPGSTMRGDSTGWWGIVW